MNNNSSKQILLSVIGVAILVVAVVGVSFAFFSYVSKGTNTNYIDTGTIIFDSSDTALELDNVFPTNEAGANFGNVRVSGSTSYDKGIDFIVRAANIQNANAEILPTIIVAASQSKPDAVELSYVYSGDGLPTDGIIARGHIDGGENVTGVETLTEIITVKAYYDRAKYHITDNTLEELTYGGIKPDYVTASTKLVSPTDWNKLVETGHAYSFTLDVIATQGDAGRLPAAD